MAKILLAIGTLLVAVSAVALDFGPGWEIVIRDREPTGVFGRHWGAAETLSKDLKRVTGYQVPVRFASNATGAKHTIFIGEQFAAAAGVLPRDMTNWSNGIVEKNGNIYLFGRDRAARTWKKGEHPNWRYILMPSLRAMTRFMYTFMGVRFVMPGNNGRAVPTGKTVTIPDGYVDREDPEFEYTVSRTYDVVYMLGNGLFSQGRYMTYGGHSYPDAVPQSLFKEHPEYFALRGGKRVLGPTVGQTAVCISNPDVKPLMIKELLKRFDAGADICQLAQSDGNSKCDCAACAKLYGVTDWGEKLWLYHRDIALEIKKLRPGKIVHIICYADTAKPPKTFKEFPSNVMIELCSYSEASFANWKNYKVPHGFTVYTYLWGEYQPVGFTPSRSFIGLNRLMRRLRDNRVHGIYHCGCGVLPGIEGPQYYYFNRLMVDPKAEIEATLVEFCDAAFGKEAGEPMKRFYEEIDRRLRARDAISIGHYEAEGKADSKYTDAMPTLKLDLLASIYTPETLNVLDGCLRHAEAAKTITPEERIRLNRVRLEYDYTRNIGRIAGLYQAYRHNPSRAYFEPLAQEVEWRNAFLDKVFDEKGNVRKLADWPDVPLFAAFPRSMVEKNGRLSGTLSAPLDWNIAEMRREENYPGDPSEVARWKKYNSTHPIARVTKFKVASQDRDTVFTPRADGSSFTFATPPGKTHACVYGIAQPLSGTLKPNTRYRAAWFAKCNDVVPFTSWEGGFYTVLEYGGGSAGRVREPSPRQGLVGTSNWQRMSKTFCTGPKPFASCAFHFVILNTTGEVEIEDVTLEEIQ